MVAMGRKGGHRDTRPVDPLTGRILTPNKPTDVEQPKDDEDGNEDSPSTPWNISWLQLLLRFFFLRNDPSRDELVFNAVSLNLPSRSMWCALPQRVLTFKAECF